MQKTWDVIVVGGGVAGLSAALMLGRARRRVLVVDHGQPRNRFAAVMHGVLGHDGRDPLELLATGRAEVEQYGVEVRSGAVITVSDSEPEEVASGSGLLRVDLEDGSVEWSRALIAATGVRDDLPDIPGLAERWGTTVLHCPYCHGWEVRGGRFGVLATGPMSLHQAQLVRQWSDSVTVFDAGIGPIEEPMAQRLRSRDVRLIASPVAEVIGEGDQVTGVRTEDGIVTVVDAIFTGGVLQPLDDYLSELALHRTDDPHAGRQLAVDPAGRTSHPWVRVAGNLASPMANVPMAMNSGSMAGAMLNMDLVSADFDAALIHEPSPGLS